MPSEVRALKTLQQFNGSLGQIMNALFSKRFDVFTSWRQPDDVP